uniref:Uncharacterized protein n=1 Tax=Trichobilharzia regenti TaxID=157069 RepID=A0AA85JPD1_TRIRE|nr:unnamed protein product [Trichobilharzia regenti]
MNAFRLFVFDTELCTDVRLFNSPHSLLVAHKAIVESKKECIINKANRDVRQGIVITKNNIVSLQIISHREWIHLCQSLRTILGRITNCFQPLVFTVPGTPTSQEVYTFLRGLN